MNCMCETGMVELCNMSCPNYQKYVEEFIKEESEERPPPLERQGPPIRCAGRGDRLSPSDCGDESIVRKDR